MGGGGEEEGEEAQRGATAWERMWVCLCREKRKNDHVTSLIHPPGLLCACVRACARTAGQKNGHSAPFCFGASFHFLLNLGTHHVVLSPDLMISYLWLTCGVCTALSQGLHRDSSPPATSWHKYGGSHVPTAHQLHHFTRSHQSCNVPTKQVS